MTVQGLAGLPGYRRRFIVMPEPGKVTAALEDDYHCMAVTLHHQGAVITTVDADFQRAPWTTCPGAPAKVKSTFEGVGLADAASRGEKQSNCTHLHDLATLAAAHAGDASGLQYDILVSDIADGRNASEVWRDGVLIHRWEMEGGFVLTAPAAASGLNLMKLRGWIETLDGPEREAARLLQWGSIVAHGRARPMAEQSDASKMPPNCFTFQPENAISAVRVGKIIDFSDAGGREPLSHFSGHRFTGTD